MGLLGAAQVQFQDKNKGGTKHPSIVICNGSCSSSSLLSLPKPHKPQLLCFQTQCVVTHIIFPFSFFFLFSFSKTISSSPFMQVLLHRPRLHHHLRGNIDTLLLFSPSQAEQKHQNS